MEYASLYRRFRPQRFDEVLGQDHVTRALRNALINNKVGHAYLFSGPRGTGKTSTARILAKALNCTNRVHGEPCCTCPSCVSVTQGRSMDVIELDAASNSGVDAMKSLVSLAPVGTTGEWKVYILDEVHMLTTAASNALLKTLEEPPPHVIFVLATTDPQKVLPTILSRTQSFEFRLLDQSILEKLVEKISGSADLNIGEQEIDYVIKKGRGSARDTLSFLDQVVALGGIDDSSRGIAEIFSAIADSKPAEALLGVGTAINKGLEPSRILSEIINMARDHFLKSFNKSEANPKLPTARLVKIVEVLGSITTQLRDSPDPRATIEAALIRLSEDQIGLPAEIEEFIKKTITSHIGRIEISPSVPLDSERPTPSATPDGPQEYESTKPIKPRHGSSSISTQSIENARNRLNSGEAKSEESGVARLQANLKRGTVEKIDLPIRNVEVKEQTAPVNQTPPSELNSETPVNLDHAQLISSWPEILAKANIDSKWSGTFREGTFIAVDWKSATFTVDNSFVQQQCEHFVKQIEDVIKERFDLKQFTIHLSVIQRAPDYQEKNEPAENPTELIDQFSGAEKMDRISVAKRIKEVFPHAVESLFDE